MDFLPKRDAYDVPDVPDTMVIVHRSFAWYTATGILNGTYRATFKYPIERILALAMQVDPLFLAKAALYTKADALMSDVAPIVYAVALHNRDEKVLLERIYAKVFASGPVDSALIISPYNILCDFLNSGVLTHEKLAIQPVLEMSIDSIPKLHKSARIVVCPDLGAHMDSLIVGRENVTCRDISALITTGIVRHNPQTRVLPFNDRIQSVQIQQHTSITEALWRLYGASGGESEPFRVLQALNRDAYRPDLVIIVTASSLLRDGASSDNMSQVMIEWAKIRDRHANARLVYIDLQPIRDPRFPGRKDILNIQGFSDDIFEVIKRFHLGSMDEDLWARLIAQVEI